MLTLKRVIGAFYGLYSLSGFEAKLSQYSSLNTWLLPDATGLLYIAQYFNL